MHFNLRLMGFIALLCAISVMAGNRWVAPQDDPTRRQQKATPQDDRTRRRANAGNQSGDDKKNQKKGDKKDDKNADVKAQPILEENEEIPDSLLHPRWKIQRTQPITDDDLSQGSADLQRPENMKQTVEYNDTICLARDLEFPISYYGLDNAYPTLYLKSNFKSNDKDKYSRNIWVNAIILKPKE